MSNFGQYIEEQFPGVKFTGGSGIHRSKMGAVGMPHQGQDMSKIIAALHHGAIGLALWDHLMKWFSEMDWQVTAEEFRAIVLVDVFRHLKGEGDTKEPSKIRNPSTGNVFHRLAIRNDIVGGVRLWHNHDLEFGFRFRLAKMTDDDKKNVPLIARKKALTSITVAEEVIKQFKIAEPTPEEVKKVRASVFVK